MTEHARLGFDAANTPAHNAEAIDHCRVRVGADEGVGVKERGGLGVGGQRTAQNAFGQVFEIHLMDYADTRRHHLERVERLHAPLEKLVTLAVAPEIHLEIALQCVRRTGEVHLHGMIHHQIHRHERFDDFRVLSHARHGGTHRRQVHQQGNTGEVLQYDARHDERNLLGAFGPGRPVGQRLHVGFGHFLPVAIAQDRFKH